LLDRPADDRFSQGAGMSVRSGSLVRMLWSRRIAEIPSTRA
jgi:hypothetical protein